MIERPILFNGPMVRAILEGRKTQTRRVVRHQPPGATREVFTFHHPDPRTHYWAFDGGSLLDWSHPCPQGEIGDRLYVRETWQHSNHPFGPYESDCLVFYRADYLDDPLGPDLERSADGIRREWRPSIHMPRAAARITLEITGVRVERLQHISESDARAEGVTIEERHKVGYCLGGSRGADRPPSIRAFHDLWDSLNAARGHGWDVNPWVWRIEFRRIES
ncbi:hypothetical protein [Burkholderia multivorans]|uniref:hypothetical protein n=1 Tax=Burkholderia multivorans TaxID=87883 RepID=UPI0019D1F697|nr:hypothetical protein [Burkholderia multivorans]MBN6728502.1 hypothetical protein [Burkholderia multivorans]